MSGSSCYPDCLYWEVLANKFSRTLCTPRIVHLDADLNEEGNNGAVLPYQAPGAIIDELINAVL